MPSNYSFVFKFNTELKKKVVTNIDFQVTNLTTNHQFKLNTMPASFAEKDTIKFIVDYSTNVDKVNSCLFTSYPVNANSPDMSPFASPYDRASIDFIGENLLGQALEVSPDKGSWIFHMMGLYRNNNKYAAYYLDPEATCNY